MEQWIEEELKKFEAALNAQAFSNESIKVHSNNAGLFLNYLNAIGKKTKQAVKGDIILFLDLRDKELKSASINWEVPREKSTPRTKKFFLSCIKKFYKEKEGMEKLVEQILEMKRKKTGIGFREPVQLTTDEVKALVNTNIAKSPGINARNAMIIKYLFCTGMRRTEIENLKISDLRLEEKTQADNKLVSIIGKGNKQRRIVVPKWLIDETKKYIDTVHKGQSETLFFSAHGGKLGGHSIWFIVKAKAANAEIPEKKVKGIMYNGRTVHPHMLRSTFASEKLQDGENLLVIQELLGHANPSTTKKYTKISDNQLEKVKPSEKV